MSDIIELLNQLADLQTRRALVLAEKEHLIYTAIPDDVHILLGAIEEEFGPLVTAAEQNIKQLTEQIKVLVIQHGKSVKGAQFQAVYNAGRVKWDDGNLQGYAVAHPEIEQFRTTGEPSVTIREVK